MAAYHAGGSSTAYAARPDVPFRPGPLPSTSAVGGSAQHGPNAYPPGSYGYHPQMQQQQMQHHQPPHHPNSSQQHRSTHQVPYGSASHPPPPQAAQPSPATRPAHLAGHTPQQRNAHLPPHDHGMVHGMHGGEVARGGPPPLPAGHHGTLGFASGPPPASMVPQPHKGRPNGQHVHPDPHSHGHIHYGGSIQPSPNAGANAHLGPHPPHAYPYAGGGVNGSAHYDLPPHHAVNAMQDPRAPGHPHYAQPHYSSVAPPRQTNASTSSTAPSSAKKKDGRSNKRSKTNNSASKASAQAAAAAAAANETTATMPLGPAPGKAALADGTLAGNVGLVDEDGHVLSGPAESKKDKKRREVIERVHNAHWQALEARDVIFEDLSRSFIAQSNTLLLSPQLSRAYVLPAHSLLIERDASLQRGALLHAYQVESARSAYESERARAEDEARIARKNVRDRLLAATEERRRRLREEKESGDGAADLFMDAAARPHATRKLRAKPGANPPSRRGDEEKNAGGGDVNTGLGLLLGEGGAELGLAGGASALGGLGSLFAGLPASSVMDQATGAAIAGGGMADSSYMSGMRAALAAKVAGKGKKGAKGGTLERASLSLLPPRTGRLRATSSHYARLPVANVVASER
ncbi:Sds3-like [Ceraceosorus bombacis]|uniref:Sds3-like n=1 Tax=Ceraceosorus bombacis TaxID=401625 RepID=A0A0P1BR23_9BASI|nr:Sds3-like [Ceraceosorus bombacis]